MFGITTQNFGTVIVFVVCDYTMILYASTTVDLYPFFIGHYTPSPSPPVPFGPSFIPSPLSLPLLTRLPRYQVTVHLSEIADHDIAEVTRLASLLPTSSTPSCHPVETYT